MVSSETHSAQTRVHAASVVERPPPPPPEPATQHAQLLYAADGQRKGQTRNGFSRKRIRNRAMNIDITCGYWFVGFNADYFSDITGRQSTASLHSLRALCSWRRLLVTRDFARPLLGSQTAPRCPEGQQERWPHCVPYVACVAIASCSVDRAMVPHPRTAVALSRQCIASYREQCAQVWPCAERRVKGWCTRQHPRSTKGLCRLGTGLGCVPPSLF